jgi:VanZ family protein
VNAQAGETIRSTFTLAKFGHVIEYSVLALLVLRALCGAAGGVALPLGRAIVMTVVAAALFGGLDELRQSLVPNREPRLSDIALDTVSALVALLAVAGWQRLRQSVMSARTAQAREGSRA